MPIDPASVPGATDTDSSVSPSQHPETTQIDQFDLVSSNLSSAQYDPKTGRLLVTFSRGDRRLFEGVPPNKVEELKNAPSAGRYFREEIAGYPMTKV